MLMRIIEHNSSKRIRTGYRRVNSLKAEQAVFPKTFLYTLIKQHFLVNRHDNNTFDRAVNHPAVFYVTCYCRLPVRQQ